MFFKNARQTPYTTILHTTIVLKVKKAPRLYPNPIILYER